MQLKQHETDKWISTDVENHSRFLLRASENYFYLFSFIKHMHAELHFKIILDKLSFSLSVTLRDIFTWPILQIGALTSYKEVRKNTD